jgi:hypothetical protein
MGALGSNYTLGILIINATYDCIFILSLTQDNVLNKVPNPYILFERFYPKTQWGLIEILYIGCILSPRPSSFSVVMLRG